VALAHPLQRIATVASTYALQTLGFAAYSEGNVIRLGEIRIGVKAACSGLSMMLIFSRLATAIAVVCRRPPLERGLIFVSAIPIALLANSSASRHGRAQTVGSGVADYVFPTGRVVDDAAGSGCSGPSCDCCRGCSSRHRAKTAAARLRPWIPQPATTKKEQAKATR
jgi:hypothetical protein